MITGTVAVDIRNVDEDGTRGLVWSQVGDAPRGVRVVLMVGTKPVSTQVVDILRDIRADLDVEVQGSAKAVRNWVEVLRDGYGVT